jgi:hypothetical protein
MPSPRGTNHAGLFLPYLSPFIGRGPSAACDSARDEDNPEVAPNVASVIKRLAKMSPEKLTRLFEMLDDDADAEDTNLLESEMLGPSDPRAFPDRKTPGMDQPPNFAGEPRVGGKITAMDSKTGKPNPDYFGHLAQSRLTAKERKFASMFPGAMDIKVR